MRGVGASAWTERPPTKPWWSAFASGKVPSDQPITGGPCAAARLRTFSGAQTVSADAVPCEDWRPYVVAAIPGTWVPTERKTGLEPAIRSRVRSAPSVFATAVSMCCAVRRDLKNHVSQGV